MGYNFVLHLFISSVTTLIFLKTYMSVLGSGVYFTQARTDTRKRILISNKTTFIFKTC